MRLWHTDLIEVLPRQQLLGQWRELNSIFKNQNRHILINFVYDHSPMDLFRYSLMVTKEIEKRGYKINTNSLKEYFKDKISTFCITRNQLPPFFDKMNDRYLKQCLYNLQEKYDCGGITDEEWKRITDKFGGMI